MRGGVGERRDERHIGDGCIDERQDMYVWERKRGGRRVCAHMYVGGERMCVRGGGGMPLAGQFVVH